jgi:hypothetical protein
MIEEIDLIPISLSFIATHTIQSFTQRENLKELWTIDMVIINIYCGFAKAFILFVADGLEIVDMQVLTIFLEFYVQYMKLVEIHATRKLVTILIFGEQQLVTNFASCFVILAHDNGVVERLSKVHHKKIECQDFVTNF